MENLLLLFDQPDHPILQQIGWSRLAKEWASLTYFEQNQRTLLRPPTAKDPQEILQLYQELEYLKRYQDESSWATYLAMLEYLPAKIDPQQSKLKLSKMGILVLPELNMFILFWEQMLSMPKKIFENYVGHEIDDNAKKVFNSTLLNEFRKFVDKLGNVDLYAHPTIGAKLNKLKDHDGRVKELLLALMKQKYINEKLQYESYDIIYGHYVLPLRSDRFSASLGKIIHRSDSGSTLFVELYEMQQWSQIRTELQEEINQEIFLLEKRYSEIIHQFSGSINLIIDSIVTLDYLWGKTLWALKTSGSIPEISSDLFFDLENFYHPLTTDPIRNSLLFDVKKNVMLISGPNTGGKSVILKSIALNILLLHAGLPIYSDKSKIYPFKKIFFLGQDDQNLDLGLSSFAAEAKQIIEIIDIAEPSLLLVDEIFSSTSSEEASAIAYGVMSYWQERGIGAAIFTSHHQSLKTWVQENKKMVSAHVGFNLELAQPTYKLHVGSPGSSFAVAIFEKFLKFSSSYTKIIRLVKEKQGDGFDYENLLVMLQEKENEYQELVKNEKALLQELKSQLNAQKIDLESKKAEEIGKFRHELGKIKKQAYGVVVQLGPVRGLHKSVDNEFWAINKELEKLEGPKEKLVDDSQPRILAKKIIVNKSYYSTQWKRAVLVNRVFEEEKMCEVSMGNIKTKVSFNALYELEQKQSPQIIVNVERTSAGPDLVFDARGLRLDDFQNQIENKLSYLLSGDIPFLEIIHGHGDGVLKTWTRQYIASMKDQFTFEIPDHSNDGSTKILLKN